MNEFKMTCSEWAYLAGLVEGHGSFSIMRWGEKGFGIELMICSSHPILLNWLILKFKGSTRVMHPPKKSTYEFRKSHSYWTASRKDIIPICLGILPYVLVKKKHCEIMIEMRKLMQKKRSNKGNRGFIPFSDKEIEQRTVLAEMLIEENNKFRREKEIPSQRSLIGRLVC